MNAHKIEERLAPATPVPISRGVRSLFEARVRAWATRVFGPDGIPTPLQYRLDVVKEPGVGALSCELTVQSGALIWRSSDYGAELQSLVLRCLRELKLVVVNQKPKEWRK
jgi:hypothetical protein